MRKFFLIFLLPLLFSTAVKSQIGYQVSLLNNATGVPRANEQVTCHVELTDKNDAAVWSEDITTMSNEFGVISLTVGNSSMFKDFKWAENLPLYISVKVDDVLIGKSQVLNVPTAEYSKYSGVLTPEKLCDVNIDGISGVMNFQSNGICTWEYTDHEYIYNGNLNYYIDGNNVYIKGSINEFNKGVLRQTFTRSLLGVYVPSKNILGIISLSSNREK